jgi:hypothetical protein
VELGVTCMSQRRLRSDHDLRASPKAKFVTPSPSRCACPHQPPEWKIFISPHTLALLTSAAGPCGMQVFLGLDAPHPVLWASDDWLDFCGRVPSEVIGQPLCQDTALNAESIQLVEDAIREEGSVNVTLTDVTYRGTSYCYEADIQPLRNRAHSPPPFLVAATWASLLLHLPRSRSAPD